MEKSKLSMDPQRDRRFLFNALLIITLILAGWVRFFGLEWDQGTHLHPDERYLTMVASAIRFPDEISNAGDTEFCDSAFACLGLYWNTGLSPLNPANYDQFAGYVYGTLPLFVTRAAGQLLNNACGDASNPAVLEYLAIGFRLLFLGTNSPCNDGHYTGYSGIHLVGRALSATADLITLMGLVLLARVLYGDRIAIVSGLLYAFAVLPIQHAHFFVVDSFATVFVIWTLYFCVLAYSSRLPLILVGAGAFTGLAVASKISVWPLAGIVGLTGLLIFMDTIRSKRLKNLMEQWPITLSLLLSGVFAAVMFRIGQPYAFAGPGFFNVAINPKWLDTMKEIRELMSGLRDVPFGHQWANRTPILFPLKNMILWGMGLPLGIASWLGWGVMGWRLWKHNRYAHAVPWVWATVFFFYQSTQWVKSMRYLLPIYPVFALMAAWFLVRFLTVSQRKPSGKILCLSLSKVARIVLLAVVCGTFIWACAFLNIYAQPLTRVAASEWMYENVPTAVTLHTLDGDIQVPVRPSTILFADSPTTVRVPTQENDRTVTGVTLNKYNTATPGTRTVSIVIDNTVAVGALEPAQDTFASSTIEFNEPVKLYAGQQYDMILILDIGDSILLTSSVIANEHWDDPLPQRMDGKDPFWNWYQSLSSSPSTQMSNYDNDTLDKRRSLIAWLDEADYIALSSNRLYGSIPRLPLRYPFTTQYYALLFSGDLGFDLIAEFVSYPQLGPCQFPDQEIPFPLIDAKVSNRAACSIKFSPAEEAFSVYDHPTVLIFAKNEAYSSEKVASALPDDLLNNVQWMTPLDATRGQGERIPSLLMDMRTRIAQESGGTWARIFNRSALQNRFPLLSASLWWLLLTLLGWLAFPWVYSLFPKLHYRGYGISKTVGLLLWSYLVWLLASLRIAPFTRLTLWGVFVLLVVIIVLATRKNHKALLAFISREWRNLLRLELLFLGLYAAWVLVRYFNPDLWHPVTGGEKPMDFAYLNAVVKSTWFPPYDPWFAGGKLNYYYFGFVMIGSLIKATGIIPSVAYNLAVPSLFALTGLGAYTVAANLSGTDKRKGNRAGLWGILLVIILGNLGEARLLFKGYEAVGNVQFDSLIPGYPATVSALVGLWKNVVNKVPLGFRPEWWYWDATRVIPFAQGEVGPINEFPAFTFLYADLHAHMMAFPITLVALSIVIQWAVGGGLRVKKREGWLSYIQCAFPQPFSSLLLAGLVAGALRATNTWDYPTYLTLMALASLFPLFRALRLNKNTASGAQRPNWSFYLRFLTPLVVFGIAELLFLPFSRNYAVVYSSFEPWEGSRTTLGIYFIMYGLFLFPIMISSVMTGGQLIHDAHTRDGRYPLKTFLVFGLCACLLIILFVYLIKVPIAWIVIPLGLMALAFLVADGTSTRRQMLWLWIGTALALSLGVEFIVLKGDIGRMNTVFKFYLQVWMLLGLCAAVLIEHILHHAFMPSAKPSWIEKSLYDAAVDLVSITLAILLFAAGLYPALAIPAKIRDRWAPSAPTSLDGAAFIPYAIQEEHGSRMSLASDYAVILWLQENVEGSPTIMEAQAEREYLWGGRISIHTGLPAIAAWRWHQVQQRMVMPAGTVEERQRDVRLFYNTTYPDKAIEILRQYQIEYVILTPYERAYMIPEGTAKFSTLEDMGVLSKVYESGESAIYAVTGL